MNQPSNQINPVNSAEYITSSVKLEQCPEPDYPEYAFIGRSNVGKSSLINYLTGRKNLARISSNPGKTQTINHYLINKQWYLVDLPGYGYARVSKKEREKWIQFIRDYIVYRLNLGNVFVLVDASIPPQAADIDFMQWLGGQGIAFSIIFTKTDKAKEAKVTANINAMKQRLLEYWEELPPVFETSAKKKEGGEDLYQFIQEVNRQFTQEG